MSNPFSTNVAITLANPDYSHLLFPRKLNANYFFHGFMLTSPSEKKKPSQVTEISFFIVLIRKKAVLLQRRKMLSVKNLCVTLQQGTFSEISIKNERNEANFIPVDHMH